MENDLWVVQGAEFWDPVFDVGAVGVVVVCLYMLTELLVVGLSNDDDDDDDAIFRIDGERDDLLTCFTGLKTRVSRGSLPTPAVYLIETSQLVLK